MAKTMQTMQTFEIESGELDADLLSEQVGKRQCCFPLEVLPFCPAGIRNLIPKQFHYFQGWIHLWLFLGVVSCFALAIHAFVNCYRYFAGKKEELHAWGVQEAIELVFTLPVLYYFLSSLGQYDDDLHTKKALAEAARRKLIDAYMETLDDMSEILDAAAEVNAGFAERGFENKRRDFIRFLERWQQKFSAVSINSGSDEMKDLYTQLKRFIINWFNVFKECSIDVMRFPNIVVTESELDKCQSVDELCALCIHRLKLAEVKFISANLEKDKTHIESSKKQLHNMTFVGSKIATTFAQSHKSPNPWALVTDAAGKGVGYLTGISWLVFGCKRRADYRLEAGLEDDSGFPCLCPFGCGILVILSREHIILLVGYCIGYVMLALEVLLPNTKMRMLALLSVFQVTTTLTLIRFEKIDILQRLAKEARTVQKEKEAVQERHQEMKKFWTKAQLQTDLWLHRTVPHLDLFSEIHGQLEDMSQELALEGMSIANTKLEFLNESLGPLDYWFSDGVLSELQKKDFDQTVQSICQETQFTKIMYRLDGLNESTKKLIAATSYTVPRLTHHIKRKVTFDED